jgi:opacity protein-like surface antigen
MKSLLLVSALALSAMTTVALAESVKPVGSQAGPVPLTSAQMDEVTAGKLVPVVIPLGWQAGNSHASATLVSETRTESERLLFLFWYSHLKADQTGSAATGIRPSTAPSLTTYPVSLARRFLQHGEAF